MSILINFLNKIKIKNILLFFLIVFIIIILLYYYYQNSDNTNSKVLNHSSRNSNDKKITGSKKNNNNHNSKMYSSSTYINNINYFSNMNINNNNPNNLKIIPEKYNDHIIKMRIMKNKIKNLMARNNINSDINKNSISSTINTVEQFLLNKTNFLTSHIQLFYYHPIDWYKTIENGTGSSGKVLNINFYPYYGLYNGSNELTANSEIVIKHLNFIRNSGINCIILTVTNKNFMRHTHLINVLLKFNINFTVQIDNYANRTIASIREILAYFFALQSPRLLKIYSVKYKKWLPIVYIKCIGDIDEISWKLFLYDKNKNYYSLNNNIIVNGNDNMNNHNNYNNVTTVRDTNLNCLFIGQIIDADDKFAIKKFNFDGFYTLLPSNGATYSSTWKNWSVLKKFSDSYNLIFVPTIGPGYDEIKKQPKNAMLRRHRSSGNYYGVAWRTAISLNPSFITISSFNNWVEGTQIEPAIPKTGFKDYLPGKPTKYLEITKQYVFEYIKIKNQTIIDNLRTLKCKDFFNLTVC